MDGRDLSRPSRLYPVIYPFLPNPALGGIGVFSIGSN